MVFEEVIFDKVSISHLKHFKMEIFKRAFLKPRARAREKDALVIGAKFDADIHGESCRLAFCGRHGLAQSPRLAPVNRPLIGDERLEHRALRGGHRGERQPPLTGSVRRKKLKVERLRHGSARRTTDPFSTCHDTTLRRPTRRPSLPTPDATQRTFV
jgi:hypothetical protein